MRVFEAGEHEEARRLQWRILHLNAAVTSGYGVAGLNLGYYGGPCRSPLPSTLPDADKAVARELLRDMDLIE